ncbi:unnamed protein product, partial [Staurois parvus]
MRRRVIGAQWQIRGLAAAMEARNLPAPYDKKWNTPGAASVRRPESGTWQKCGDGDTQQWEAVQGPMKTLWTWQQHE